MHLKSRQLLQLSRFAKSPVVFCCSASMRHYLYHLIVLIVFVGLWTADCQLEKQAKQQDEKLKQKVLSDFLEDLLEAKDDYDNKIMNNDIQMLKHMAILKKVGVLAPEITFAHLILKLNTSAITAKADHLEATLQYYEDTMKGHDSFKSTNGNFFLLHFATRHKVDLRRIRANIQRVIDGLEHESNPRVRRQLFAAAIGAAATELGEMIFGGSDFNSEDVEKMIEGHSKALVKKLDANTKEIFQTENAVKQLNRTERLFEKFISQQVAMFANHTKFHEGLLNMDLLMDEAENEIMEDLRFIEALYKGTLIVTSPLFGTSIEKALDELRSAALASHVDLLISSAIDLEKVPFTLFKINATLYHIVIHVPCGSRTDLHELYQLVPVPFFPPTADNHNIMATLEHHKYLGIGQQTYSVLDTLESCQKWSRVFHCWQSSVYSKSHRTCEFELYKTTEFDNLVDICDISYSKNIASYQVLDPTDYLVSITSPTQYVSTCIDQLPNRTTLQPGSYIVHLGRNCGFSTSHFQLNAPVVTPVTIANGNYLFGSPIPNISSVEMAYTLQTLSAVHWNSTKLTGAQVQQIQSFNSKMSSIYHEMASKNQEWSWFDYIRTGLIAFGSALVVYAIVIGLLKIATLYKKWKNAKSDNRPPRTPPTPATTRTNLTSSAEQAAALLNQQQTTFR